jgi:hypothetical protein
LLGDLVVYSGIENVPTATSRKRLEVVGVEEAEGKLKPVPWNSQLLSQQGLVSIVVGEVCPDGMLPGWLARAK